MKPILMAPRMALTLRNTKIDSWPAEPIDQTKQFKWQTRRSFSKRMVEWMRLAYQMGEVSPFILGSDMHENDYPYVVDFCPYGRPGDHLYAKENYKYADWTEDGEPIVEYCDGQMLMRDGFDEEQADKLMDIWADLSDPDNYAIDGRAADRKWRPSIYMPRWASRTHLKIEGVRIERLRDISESDAIAEGFESRDEFLRYYAERNKKSPEANPWVWVLEFRRVM